MGRLMPPISFLDPPSLQTMGKRDRDIDVDEIFSSINLDKGLRSAVLDLTQDELAVLLAELANHANLPNAAFKKAGVDLPSFSTVKWSEFSAQYGLPANPSSFNLKLDSFTTPRYQLPPSLHEALFENAWQWQDVYGEKIVQQRQLRLMEPV
jgi:hypothetical protein